MSASTTKKDASVAAGPASGNVVDNGIALWHWVVWIGMGTRLFISVVSEMNDARRETSCMTVTPTHPPQPSPRLYSVDDAEVRYTDVDCWCTRRVDGL